MLSKLQYISQGITAREQVENIERVLDAGCKWIQLRFKNTDAKEFTKVAELVKNKCASYQATLIINDHVEIAKNIDADGIHLGLNDLPVIEARTILGQNKIIGGTANTLADVLKRVEEKCDYIGLGPFRFTATKEKLSPVLGLNGYEIIMRDLAERKIQIPVYAIGGIQTDDVESIINTGVYGVAVSGAITNDANKAEVIQKFYSTMYEKINHSK